MKFSKNSYYPFERKFSRFHTVSASQFFLHFKIIETQKSCKKRVGGFVFCKKRGAKNGYGTVYPKCFRQIYQVWKFSWTNWRPCKFLTIWVFNHLPRIFRPVHFNSELFHRAVSFWNFLRPGRAWLSGRPWDLQHWFESLKVFSKIQDFSWVFPPFDTGE